MSNYLPLSFQEIYLISIWAQQLYRVNVFRGVGVNLLREKKLFKKLSHIWSQNFMTLCNFDFLLKDKYIWHSLPKKPQNNNKKTTTNPHLFHLQLGKKLPKASLMDSGLVIMIHLINGSSDYCTFPISSYLISFRKPIVSWKQNKSKASVFIF